MAGSYGAFSVSPEDVPRGCAYIERQKQHHAEGVPNPDWERCAAYRDDE